jgi:hypothetical protein
MKDVHADSRRGEVAVVKRTMQRRPVTLPVLEVHIHSRVSEEHADVFDRRVIRRRAREVEHRPAEPVTRVHVRGRSDGRHRVLQMPRPCPALAAAAPGRGCAAGPSEGGRGAAALQRALEGMLVPEVEVRMERAHAAGGGRERWPRAGAAGAGPCSAIARGGVCACALGGTRRDSSGSRRAASEMSEVEVGEIDRFELQPVLVSGRRRR